MKYLLSVLVILVVAGCSKESMTSTSANAQNVSATPKLSTLSVGNTYYVDPAGSDSNDGLSTTTPWKTLAKVDSITFSPGDQILFKCGGVWSGKLNLLGSGTSGSPIVINMYGTGNKPVINGPATNGSAALAIINQSYWEVNNLELTNTQVTGGTNAVKGISVNNTGTTAVTHVYIQNCYVHDVNSVAYGGTSYTKASGGIIYSGYFNDVLVKNCHVNNCATEGIRTTSSSIFSTQVVFDSNLVENVYGDGMVISSVASGCAMTNNVVHNACTTNAANYAGIWTYASTGTKVAYNEVYGLTGGNIDGQAFDADINTNGDLYEYNYSHDNSRGFMLFMPSATNIVVRHNVSVNDCTGGTKMFNYLSSYTTNKIYNNTFYLSNNISEFFETGFNSMFNDNIIYTTASVSQFSTSAVNSSSVIQNNCFYPSSITATNGPAGTVSGNINTDPSFVSAGSHGTGMSSATAYELNSGSPCYNTGIFVHYDGGVDYNGNLLPGTNPPDIGAFQHTATTTNFITTADTYVRDGTYASDNYGTATTLVVKSDATSYNRKAYTKFDFTSVTAPQVQSATLSLYVSFANTDPTRTISVYTTATENWGETSMTWNTAPMDTTYVGSLVVTGTGTYTLDVSGAVNSQLLKPDHLVSFLLLNKGTASSKSDIQINSREASSNNPQLSITY